MYAYRWSAMRRTYEVFDRLTGTTVSYHDDVTLARAKVDDLNRRARRGRR